jgi:hypothetical protein
VATGASKRGAAEWLFAACGVWLLLLGIYFIFVRPALLPEDLRYVEAELAALRAAAPRIELWSIWSSPSWAASWPALECSSCISRSMPCLAGREARCQLCR